MAERFIEKRLASMKARSHARVVAMARGMDGVINLGGGDPDFDTPSHITDALLKGIAEGKTHYPPPPGLPALRSAVAEYHGKHNVDWENGEVTITAGSGVSLFAATTGTVNPGEEVILLEPYFMAYSNLVEYVGAIEVGIPLDVEEGYRLDIEALKGGVSGKTKMIVLCNPNNPSGTVFTKEELKGIADVAIDEDLLVLSDEVYCEFVWDGKEHTAIASLPGMRERTIISSSFSKTFAMTGWRLGYVIADQSLTSRIRKIPLGYRTNTFVQIAGVAAMQGTWEPVEAMAEEYDRRRRFMVPRLSEIEGINCHNPEGAFYLFPNIGGLGMESEEFCESLLKEKKILARPGTAFGVTGESHMRIPLIKPVDDLEDIAQSIEDHARKITGG
jgi:aspartate/methionine/tyrosine aminotransferase